MIGASVHVLIVKTATSLPTTPSRSDEESAFIRVPAALRRLTGAKDRIEVPPGSVRQALKVLDERYPGISERLLDASGNLLGYVNIYLNEEDIRFLDHLDTAAGPRDEISIIPAIAGG